jgi:hypothetical protein
VSGEGVFFEDFNNGPGQLTNVWFAGGTPHHVTSFDGSSVYIGGTYDGAGVMEMASGANAGHGNGKYEIRAQLLGHGKGDNSGPAIGLWPADNNWTAVGTGHPYHFSREVDMGELYPDGQAFFAAHWTDCGWNDYCDAHSRYDIWRGFNQWDWHVYAATLLNDRIIFEVDGVHVGTEWDHPSPDFANGNVNHCFFIMNRSSETAVRVDWVRFTPEHLLK